jgi:multiple sugar transport system permease protein
MATTTPPGPLRAVPRRRLGRSQRANEELGAYLVISPWLIGFLVFTAGAMAYSLGVSFWDTNFLNTNDFVGLANYERMLDDPLFYKSLRVTFTYTALTVPLATVVALAIALLLNQQIRFSSFFRTVYYLPAVVSGVAVALLWAWVLDPNDGLLNSLLRIVGIEGPRWFASEEWAVPGLVLIALWGTGTNMLLYLAGLQSIPTELKEASRIDGAGPVRSFFDVTLPLLTPTIFFNVVLNVIGSFQAFTQAYVLTKGGPNNATLTMVMYLYKRGFGEFGEFEFGYASAIAWALFAIILVFTLILVRSQSRWVHYEGGLRQ